MSSPDHASELQHLLSEIAQEPDSEQIISEIEVLQSIYGENAIRVWSPSPSPKNGTEGDGKIRYEAVLSLPSPHDENSIRVLVSLPSTYPSSSPPQLQLLSRYIGAFGADSSLFGSILRTYMSVNGVEWSEDTVCVFDGLQNILERCTAWYEERLSAEKAGELVRGDLKSKPMESPEFDEGGDFPEDEDRNPSLRSVDTTANLPPGVQFYVAEPITDRKSAFVGRACRIQHPSEVPIILFHLMSDRRIARAAHPIINAWRCKVNGILHQDNDDDGETAAGGRLAHLLQILEIDNVLVVVTRYFGGIHLGPDRFKHINQAGRNALEIGGFLDTSLPNKRNTGRAKKH